MPPPTFALGQMVRVEHDPRWDSVRARVRHPERWNGRIGQIVCESPLPARDVFFALLEKRGSRTGSLVFFHVSELRALDGAAEIDVAGLVAEQSAAHEVAVFDHGVEIGFAAAGPLPQNARLADRHAAVIEQDAIADLELG